MMGYHGRGVLVKCDVLARVHGHFRHEHDDSCEALADDRGLRPLPPRKCRADDASNSNKNSCETRGPPLFSDGCGVWLGQRKLSAVSAPRSVCVHTIEARPGDAPRYAALSTCTKPTRPTAESPSGSAAAATTATATCAAAAAACDGHGEQGPTNWRGCGDAAAPSRGGPGTARRG